MKQIYPVFFLIVSLILTVTFAGAQNVGIGIATPGEKLHVAGFIRSDSLSGSERAIVLSDTLGTLKRLPLPGDSTYVLSGTGTWRTLGSISGDSDWYEEGTTATPDDINDNIYTQGNVGIGISSPGYRLHVKGAPTTTDSTLAFFENTSPSASTALAGRNTINSNWSAAVEGVTKGTYGPGVQGIHLSSTGGGMGVSGQTISASGYGVVGAHAPQSATSGIGAGVWGVAYANNSAGAGVKGDSYGTNGIGVQGQVTQSTGIAVKGVNSAGWAGYFLGNVYHSGTLTPSDHRFKKNFEPLYDALNKVTQMQPYIYEFDTEKYPGLYATPGEKHYGFIAQDLAEIVPDLVIDDMPIMDPTVADTVNYSAPMVYGYKLVDYQSLTPILVQAIKEQQEMIDQLIMKNKELEGRIEALENK